MTSAAAPRLERVIGVGGLGCSIVNTIIGSGIFGLPGLAAAILGPAALVAYLVCVVLVGLVGLCFAEAGSRVPQAGGIYSYAMAAFGPVVGGIAGTLTWTANTIVPSAAVANLLVDTLAVVSPALGGGVTRMAILAGLYAVLAAVNVRGARQGARVSMALAVIKVTPLVLLVLVGVFAVRAVNLQWTAAPTLPGIAEASVVLFFAFMGMEGNMAAGGEVVHPARTIPRAIFFALGLVGALYIGLQLVAQGVLGNALPNSTAPLVETASVVLGPWGGQLLLVTTVFSVLGYMSADVLCAPRNFQALASWGQLPRVLAQVHPRYKTPAVAIVTYVVLCTVVAWSGSFRQLVIAASSGTLVLYLIGCLCVLRLRARDVALAGEPFRAPGGAAVPVTAAAIIVWLLVSLPWAELISALVLIVVSGLVYGLLDQRRRARRLAPGMISVGR